MLEGYRRLQELKPSAESEINVAELERKCYEAMDDDFNTPVLIANLFEAVGMINSVKDGHLKATAADIEALKSLMQTFLVDILGIRTDFGAGQDSQAMKPFEEAVDLLLEVRAQAKANKDWATSDRIRNRMAEIGFSVKDTKGGAEWSLS